MEVDLPAVCKRRDLRARFDAGYSVAESGCWIWHKGQDDNGYGRIRRGRTIGAHRASYELHFGEIPSGLEVCHRCDVPACVNPEHLFLGTTADNQRDKCNKGREAHPHGMSNGNARHGAEVVAMVRRLSSEGVSQRMIAAAAGMGQAHVSRIVTGRRRSVA
jgi:hypothetical protein